RAAIVATRPPPLSPLFPYSTLFRSPGRAVLGRDELPVPGLTVGRPRHELPAGARLEQLRHPVLDAEGGDAGVDLAAVQRAQPPRGGHARRVARGQARLPVEGKDLGLRCAVQERATDTGGGRRTGRATGYFDCL